MGDLEIVWSKQAESQIKNWTRLGVQWDQEIFISAYDKATVRG